jgi:anti-sigma-K factor RskA
MDAIARTPQERPRMAAVRTGPWRRWAPGLAAAAAVLAVVASIGAFVVERERVQDLRLQQASVSAVLAADDAEESALELDGGAKLRVVSSPSLGQAVVVSSDMPEAGPGKDYEVWAVGDDGPSSAGIMEPGEGGAPKVQVVDGLGDASALAITVEPEGGSPEGKPTSTPIVQVALA